MAYDGGGNPNHDWHAKLWGFAGRISDGVIAGCRNLLAQHRGDEVGPVLIAAIVEQRVSLTEAELDFLRGAVQSSDGDTSRLTGIELTTAASVQYSFAPEAGTLPGPSNDDIDTMAIDTVAIDTVAIDTVAIDTVAIDAT